MRALVYVRVSADRAERGLGLEGQEQLCRDYAERGGLEVLEVLSEVKSAKSVRSRPVLTSALERLARGEAEVLIVAKLDRLSRSLFDFSSLLERAQREGWSLVLLDLGVDTTCSIGRLQAGIVAAVAEFERERIRERCREASAVKRARGERVGGVALTPREIAERVLELALNGATLSAIAQHLEAEGVAGARGGSRWYPSTVRALLSSAQSFEIAAGSERLAELNAYLRRGRGVRIAREVSPVGRFDRR